MYRQFSYQQQVFTILCRWALARGDIILIVKFNKEIGRLRILNKAQSPKYSKQVVFDTLHGSLFQKSVIGIGSDCIFDRIVSLRPLA